MSSLPSLSLPYNTISCIVGDGGGVVDTGVARLDVGTFCLVVRALGDVTGQHGYVLEGVSEGEGKRRGRGRGGREERGGRGERRGRGRDMLGCAGGREGRERGKEGGEREGGRGREREREGGRGRREGKE